MISITSYRHQAHAARAAWGGNWQGQTTGTPPWWRRKPAAGWCPLACQLHSTHTASALLPCHASSRCHAAVSPPQSLSPPPWSVTVNERLADSKHGIRSHSYGKILNIYIFKHQMHDWCTSALPVLGIRFGKQAWLLKPDLNAISKGHNCTADFHNLSLWHTEDNRSQ